jgi:3-hydroxyacyl-CoA dehydrogenase/enoyl-CoA hydratase/3-hydroxybutyryl-CoA epimerase
MQFIYGRGIEVFEQRAAALATRFGEGFALTDQVKAAIRKYQPQY